MRKTPRSREESEDGLEEVKLELTPMIDVTFLILVFFLCTLQFKTLSQKLHSYLPLDRGLGTPVVEMVEEAALVLEVLPGDEGLPPEQRRVRVRRATSAVPFGVLQMTEEGLRAAPSDLLARCTEWAASVRKVSPDIQAKLEVQPNVPHAFAVQALDVFTGAGYRGVSYQGISPVIVRDLEAGTVR